MPGAYAHITAVNVAAERMDEEPLFPIEGKIIVGKWFSFCELGAVSPDYPYLDLAGGTQAGAWADAMHWHNTGDRIKRGIARLAPMPASPPRAKCLAWLLGFTSHVVMDCTLHPVVNLKAGEPYEENKTAHRKCEMHQDTHIFDAKMNLGIQYADHLKNGILHCSDPDDGDKIDPDVFHLWQDMFQTVDPQQFIDNKPDIDAWHDWFEDAVRTASSRRLVALARHVAPSGASDGVLYPLLEDVEAQYIKDLAVPVGLPMDYDKLFDRAVGNVVRAWAVVASDVLTGTSLAQGFLHNWNLDNGKDEAGIVTFWS